jgi:hypothetical protein
MNDETRSGLLSYARPYPPALLMRFLELAGVTKIHRLRLGMVLWEWMAILTEKSFTMEPVPGKPGSYARRGVR